MTQHDPTESALAQALLRAGDERTRRALEAGLPQFRYGLVTAVDTTNRLATVDMAGPGGASPGFKFPSWAVPVVGDLVRVVVLPTGDRYIDDNMAAFDSAGYVKRAQATLTGGGTVTWTTTGRLHWSQRLIPISLGRDSAHVLSGYYDINYPATGTVIAGHNGTASQTAQSDGIPIPVWQALYYILPFGSNSTSIPGNFRIVNYGVETGEVPANWVLIATHNGDSGAARVANGMLLASGERLEMGHPPMTRRRMSAGAVVSNATTTGAAFEIFQPNAGTDAYIALHISGDYAGMFGLDGATNDLFWGGWSVNAKRKIHHDGNHMVTPVRFVSLGNSPYQHWNAVAVTGAGDGDNTLSGVPSSGTVAVAGYLRVNSNLANSGYSAVAYPFAAMDLAKAAGATFAQTASKSIGTGFVCPTSGNVIRVFYDPQGGTLTLWLTIVGYWTTAL